MDFERVDMREMSLEDQKTGAEQVQLVYKLNHTMPMTDEYNEVLKEVW